ncbi:DNA damage-inducible protein D [bacterium]|nr:DNA damage-inducible protein D [bacterium]
MENELLSSLHSQFESISHKDTESQIEYWYARDLQKALGYTEWRNFLEVIEKAKTACAKSNVDIIDHFVDVNKMVEIGSGSERKIEDILLTRYACYLVAQNGDSKKSQIAFAQSYFAIQTRKQELVEERIRLHERILARQKLKDSETELSQLIYERGVDERGFGRIRSKGDSALFGGNSTKKMKQTLGVPESRSLADFLPTITIAAKNLATEITNHNVKQNELRGETPITNEHVQNNQTVRKMLGERGIKPEELPPAEDLQKLERRVKADEKTLITSKKTLKVAKVNKEVT